MSWEELLAADRLRGHGPTAREIADLRALIDRDLADASLPGLSDDRRFATAYNAVLQCTRMAISCSGYRVTNRSGHHRTSLEAMELALGPLAADFSAYFDTCRRKRNMVEYDVAHMVSGGEADELLAKAREFREIVEAWIQSTHPQYAR